MEIDSTGKLNFVFVQKFDNFHATLMWTREYQKLMTGEQSWDAKSPQEFELK